MGNVVRLWFASIILFVSSCAPGEDIVSSTSSAAMNTNALNPNAMNTNALNPNAMNTNALDANAMNTNALAALEDPGPDGELARELLRYMVSCAFRADQAFDHSYVDADGVLHDVSYPGLLGLAPEWAHGPLDAQGQGWISACLASRVNAFGTPVTISSRGTHPALGVTSSERWTYSSREAAFFGNLFAGEQRVYACYDLVNSTLSRLEDRVCGSNGALTSRLLNGLRVYDCGRITVTGPCLNLLGLLSVGSCRKQANPDRYFHDCRSPAGVAYPSITTFVDGLLPL